jgi:hypothetical protein
MAHGLLCQNLYEEELNLNDLPSGIYIVALKVEKEIKSMRSKNQW